MNCVIILSLKRPVIFLPSLVLVANDFLALKQSEKNETECILTAVAKETQLNNISYFTISSD